MTKHYHSAMIGTGQATPMLAVALAGRGEQVAVIEGHLVGGSCVNAGCTPTKTLRKSARVAHMARRAGDFGVSTGDVTVDFAAAMTRMRNLVDKARIGLTGWLKNTDGIEIIRGWGAFQGRDSDRFVLSAGKATLTADKVYLNTGTRAFVPPIPGIADVPHLDNVSLLALTELPRHLIVVGGSYIGLEMGQIFRRLGSEVTVINNASRLADREDADVSAIIQGFFEEEGVRVINDATIERAEKTADGVALHLADGERIQGSHVLFATGRTANCDRLNLGSVGVKTDARGFIPTGADLATNVPGIWALGDINMRGAFTHTSTTTTKLFWPVTKRTPAPSTNGRTLTSAPLPMRCTPTRRWAGSGCRWLTHKVLSMPGGTYWSVNAKWPTLRVRKRKTKPPD